MALREPRPDCAPYPAPSTGRPLAFPPPSRAPWRPVPSVFFSLTLAPGGGIGPDVTLTLRAAGVLGIELFAAAQVLDFREFTPGRGTRAAHAAIRGRVEFLEEDRPLHRDHNMMMELVRSLEIFDAVEEEIGHLQ